MEAEEGGVGGGGEVAGEGGGGAAEVGAEALDHGGELPGGLFVTGVDAEIEVEGFGGAAGEGEAGEAGEGGGHHAGHGIGEAELADGVGEGLAGFGGEDEGELDVTAGEGLEGGEDFGGGGGAAGLGEAGMGIGQGALVEGEEDDAAAVGETDVGVLNGIADLFSAGGEFEDGTAAEGGGFGAGGGGGIGLDGLNALLKIVKGHRAFDFDGEDELESRH